MQSFLIWFVSTLIQVLTLLVFIKVILSYFMSPYHPIRETLDRVVEPMLAPIRRIVPPMGMLDFTPFVFIILLYIIRSVLINLIITIF
jgi:YggT family protein